MKLKNVLYGVAAIAAIALSSCGESDSPEKIVEEAISAAEKRCPVAESTGLAKVPSLNTQSMIACYYADSVYSARIHEVKDKYEKQELSESTLKKYKEEYDALNDAKSQAIAEIQAQYKTQIDNEISSAFAHTAQIDIPVSFSSPWSSQYKEVKCALSLEDGTLALTLTVVADATGCHRAWTINSEMNFLNHPSFNLEAVNSKGESLGRTPSHCTFNGSETDTFSATFKANDSELAGYADIDHINVKQW